MFILIMDYKSTSFGTNEHYFYTDLVYLPGAINYAVWSKEAFKAIHIKSDYYGRVII